MWGTRRERELDKELRFHIESQVEENLRAGMAWSQGVRGRGQLGLRLAESIDAVGCRLDPDGVGVVNQELISPLWVVVQKQNSTVNGQIRLESMV